VVRLGMPVVDDYLGFLDGRCRPNTVLAAGYDLKVFFAVVGKPPDEVRPADVLGFITAQRAGRTEGSLVQPLDRAEEHSGVAASTVARRLSIISGFFGYLQARAAKLLRAAQAQPRLLIRVTIEALLRTGLRVGEFTSPPVGEEARFTVEQHGLTADVE
jgi:hypothetical protein